MGITQKEQDAWHAGIAAGREIERQNAAAREHATKACNPSLQPVATAFFTEKGEVAYTGLFDRTIKALEAVKTTRMGISAGSINLYAAPVAAQPQPSGNAGELPPLPEPGMTSFDYGSAINWFTESQMQAYARAAIEADRKRRGEPVAYRLLRKNADGEWVTDGRPWCDGVPDADLVKDSEKSGQYRIEYAFAAPQPAEPVKVPSDADIDAVFNDMPDGANSWLKSWGYRQFARALLARYATTKEQP